MIVADVYDGHLCWAKEVTDGVIETTRDYRKVLDRKDVDAVVIATPDHWHIQMVLDSLAAGKHVYIEKPMCCGIEEDPAHCAGGRGIGQGAAGRQPAHRTAIGQKARELVRRERWAKIDVVRM